LEEIATVNAMVPQYEQDDKKISIMIKLQHDAYHKHLLYRLELKGNQCPQLLDFIPHVNFQCRKSIVSFAVSGISFRLSMRHECFFYQESCEIV
jgi:hypothetical protein